jgi:hypothetical protein
LYPQAKKKKKKIGDHLSKVALRAAIIKRKKKKREKNASRYNNLQRRWRRYCLLLTP